MRFRASPNCSQTTRLLGLGAACLMLANCTTDDTVANRANRKHAATSPRVAATGEAAMSPRIAATGETAMSSRIASTGELAPKTESVVRKRVKVAREHPLEKVIAEKTASYSAVGVASWYGEDFHGKRTANGETFDMNSFSAAHPSLPLPSNVRITNLGNHRSVVVRVNDRGPFVSGRVIDVSAKTAKALGFYDDGLSKVKVEYVGRAQ